MNAATEHTPIRAELVAEKLKRILNFEQPKILDELTENPRFTEVLWFLQYVSRSENYPGGLEKFTRDLIAESLDLFGTMTMAAHGAPPYSATLHKAIFDEIPQSRRRDFDLEEYVVEDWKMNYAVLLDDSHDGHAPPSRDEKCGLPWDLARIKIRDGLRDEFSDEATAHLATHLKDLCERPDVRFTRQPGWHGHCAPWYFVRVADAVLRFIDRRKEKIRASIADTTVSREIFKWLGNARSTNRSIVIEGNSRAGKTEAVRAWAKMNPGIARIVETPASGGEGELLRAVAKALGIEIRPQQRGYDLRAQIEFVLHRFCPLLIFEEASFLYPATFTRNTMPARLNGVRRSVMDFEIPCAFVWTPQTHRDARSRFLKATNFAIEQFDGRILKTVRLPEQIPHEDLLAIARIHFRDLPETHCEYIVCSAGATERNYCSDVSNIAALAYSYAKDAGRAVPNLADIKLAISEVLPSPSVAPAPAASIAAAPVPVSNRAARHMQSHRSDAALPVSRNSAPSILDTGTDQDAAPELVEQIFSSPKPRGFTPEPQTVYRRTSKNVASR